MENRAELFTSDESGLRPLRLAVFSYHLPQSGRRGGVERVAHDLAQGLARRGHEVTVWSYDAKPEGAIYEVERLPGSRIMSSWLGARATMGYLGNLLALHPGFRRCDAILAHGDSLFFPLWRRPVVRILHGSALMEAVTASSFLRRASQLGVYAQELLTSATQRNTVAVSENSRQTNPFVHKVIPNGVDLSLFKPGPRKTPEPTLLFVGSLTGRKRGTLLLEWFWNQLRPRLPNAKLWMVSPEGPHLPNVRYFPDIDEKTLISLYRRAWVFASPSRYEGFGLPYLEAMACGTPVVASFNPGSRELLGDGRYGCLATDSTFMDSVHLLLTGADQREKLIARGLNRARAFDLNLTLDRYEDLLREACTGR